MKSNSLALVITLALNAGVEEAQNAINEIERIFGISNVGTVAPASLVTPVGTVAHTQVTNVTPPADAIEGEATELDASGLPWDERIHSSSKEKNKDGTWRSRRNLDEATKKKIEKQLRATTTAPAADVATNTAAIPPAPAATPAPPALPPAPGLPPLPGANVINPAYASLVKFIAENSRSDANPAGRITDEWLTATAIPYYTQLAAGTSLQDIAHRPDLCAALESGLRISLGQ
jgi:hypothetical protein